ncbi:hypothetical protein [Pedobacter sp. ASV28]|uniref:hypothetical protein n=1 Tax=Pedobacter sp. ASV28 TaxID=2795123 RepID=UPI0018EE2516|nr:hypothetical protein [Pedobacter sp. ASV28]
MKKIFLMLAFSMLALMAKSQTTISIKEVANHLGKEVTICDSVYSSRALDNLTLLNIGGKYPKELLTVVVYKADRPKFAKEPAEVYANKRICITGKIQEYKGKLQIVVTEPKQLAVK